MTIRSDRVPARRLGQVPALDGVRGLAISLVLLHHSQLLTNGDGGSVGVSVFFVLSGFLITSLLVTEQMEDGIKLVRFYLRRALRLLPAFVAVAAASAIVLNMVGRPDDGLRSSLLAGTYVGNWILAGGTSLGPMGHSWSLAIEEQFYLVWPLILLVLWPALARRGVWILLLLAAATAALRLLLWGVGAPTERIAFGTDTQAGGLLVGAALAFAWQRDAMRIPWAVGPIAIAALCFLAWAPAFGGSYLAVGETVAVVAAGALILTALSGTDRTLTSALEWRPLRMLGLISYGAYLWHYPVMWYAGVVRGHPDLWLSLAVLVVSILLAVGSYVFIELPILRWRDRRTGGVRYARAPRLGSAAGAKAGVETSRLGWMRHGFSTRAASIAVAARRLRGSS